jgi:hypothetical protein
VVSVKELTAFEKIKKKVWLPGKKVIGCGVLVPEGLLKLAQRFIAGSRKDKETPLAWIPTGAVEPNKSER